MAAKKEKAPAKSRFRNPVTYAEKVFQSAVVEVRRKGKVTLTRPHEAWRMAKLEKPRQPERPCYMCGSVVFLSLDEEGPWICPTCHPPFNPKDPRIIRYEVPF